MNEARTTRGVKGQEVDQVFRNLKWVCDPSKCLSRKVTKRYLVRLGDVDDRVELAARLLRTHFATEAHVKEESEVKTAIDKVIASSERTSTWERNVVKRYVEILKARKTVSDPIELTIQLLETYYEQETAMEEEDELPDLIDRDAEKIEENESSSVVVVAHIKHDSSKEPMELIVIESDEDDDVHMILTTIPTPEQKRRRSFIDDFVRSSRRKREVALRNQLETQYEMAKRMAVNPFQVVVKPNENFLGRSNFAGQQMTLESVEDMERLREIERELERIRTNRRESRKRKKANRKTRLESERGTRVETIADLVLNKLRNELQTNAVNKLDIANNDQ